MVRSCFVCFYWAWPKVLIHWSVHLYIGNSSSVRHHSFIHPSIHPSIHPIPVLITHSAMQFCPLPVPAQEGDSAALSSRDANLNRRDQIVTSGRERFTLFFFFFSCLPSQHARHFLCACRYIKSREPYVAVAIGYGIQYPLTTANERKKKEKREMLFIRTNL